MPESDRRSPTQIGRQISGVWTVQAVLVVAQLIYAAITSRVISPAGFGAYAVALAIYALVGLVAVFGAGNAVARRPVEDVTADRRIATYSLLFGSVFGVVTLATSRTLADLWGDPSATASIQLVAIAVFVLPYATVLSGILRRKGRIAAYNWGSLTATLTSMLLGIGIIVVVRQPWALVTTAVGTQLLNAAIFAALVGLPALPIRNLRGSGSDLRFGFKSLVNSALNQFAYYVPTWSLSRVCGPVVFGSWNRAIIVGQLPLESTIRAAVTVVYPLFRHAHLDQARSRRVWTDMLAGTALIVFPLSGIILPLLPAAVEVLLGPQWALVGSMSMWLWAAAAVTVLRTLLSTALEASNNFRPLWASQVGLATLYLMAAVAVWRTGDWVVFAAVLVIAAGLTHGLQIAIGKECLHRPALVRWYMIALAGSGATGLLGVAIAASGISPIAQLLVGATLIACGAAVMWWARWQIGPLRRLAPIE